MFEDHTNTVPRKNAMNANDSPVLLDGDRRAIVQLDPDHPGFRDPEYRQRRFNRFCFMPNRCLNCSKKWRIFYCPGMMRLGD